MQKLSLMITDEPVLQRFRQARMSRDPRFDGEFFVAVTSTGIFCRPVCPARLPAEHNVQYFSAAEQAVHAGFRPCLRCRPDSAPRSAAWMGIQTTIHRAHQLLKALPVQPVSHIATRLGISERYLYQLVRGHLGMSPKQLQLYHQLLFAKQLLQQTRLTVNDVAIASGFNSARRLQSQMQRLWQLTPTQLQQGKNVTTETAPVTVFLACKAPYNWPQVRAFIQAHVLDAVETISQDTYTRVFNWGDAHGHISARFDDTRCGFAVSLQLTRLEYTQAVIENLGRMLDVYADPAIIEKALLAAGVRPQQLIPGLRLPATWDYFEAGCRAVLGQQISLKAANTYANQLAERTGTTNTFGQVFPGPQQVAHMAEGTLRLPASRQQTLITLAQCFISQTEPPDEATLLALKGIGPWTVQYMQMRGASHSDIYLAGDLIVRRAAAMQPFEPHKAAPWRSYLTMQMWDIALNQAGDK